jgi:PAS domain S-box-containing protein
VDEVLAAGATTGPARHNKVLVSRNGHECVIADSGAPIRMPDGEIKGVILTFRDDTERNQAEQAQQQFENLVKSSPMGMIMYDLSRDGRLIFMGANPAADKILGISCADLVGQSIEEAFPPLAQTVVPGQYRNAAATGEPWSTEQIDYSDGHINGAYEVYAFQTRPGSMAVQFLDITDRKRAEKDLADSETRYRNMFENTSSGVVVYEAEDDGADFIIREFNSSAERIEQVQRETLLGRRVTQAFPGVQEFGILDVLRRVWLTGEPEHFPLGFYQDNRIAGWRENYIYKLPAGEIVAVYDDITARKQAEEALRLERDLLSRITETSPVGITLVDSAGRITFANRFAEQELGLSRDEFETRTYNDPQWRISDVDGGPFPMDQLPFARVKATGKPVFDVQHAIELPNGRRLILSINATPVFDENNSFNGMVAAMENITRRKADEQALAIYRDQLEDLVKERTLELKEAQSKLLAAERLAVLGQFSGNVSHEIRNPLGVISTSAFYLKRRLLDADEKVIKHIDQISRQVDNCTRIIKSMLDLTRMEAPRKKRVPLDMCLESGIASAGMPPPNVQLELNAPAQDILIYADPEQLRIAFKNIVKNAFQALDTHEGGTLTVTARALDGLDPFAEITISDTGPGIPEDMHDKIFQPLFTTRAKGIGFGLSITQMIIERHGGSIQVDTGTPAGATFVIKLPLATREDAQHA